MWHLAVWPPGPFKQCRKIQHPVATTFLGSACPGQLVTRPRWRGLENARVGLLPLINSREAISIRVTNAQERSTIERTARELKTQRDAKSTKSTSNPPRQRKRSEAQKKGATQTQTGQRSPKQDHWHSHRVFVDFSASSLSKKQRAPKRHDMDVPDELPDGHEDREHLADGGLRLTRCRHLESTRRPRKTKKTKKRKRHTVRAQRRENVSPRGKTQPAAREDVGSDEAHTTYFRKKGEPQRRLAADPRTRAKASLSQPSRSVQQNWLVEKLVWWRSGALHVNVKSTWNWSAKPELDAKIPVATQAFVKVVLLVQVLWSCQI